jgi:phage/plasmid-like protein (TIGR03299 family)
MPTDDVNEAFAAERADQITAARGRQRELQARVDAGQLQRLPDGRYKVLTGFDAGEILSPLGEPVHGLDVSAGGDVALYSAVPAWHHLGTVVPGGTADVDAVLGPAGIDFEVTTVPAFYLWDGKYVLHPGQRHTVRTDTGEALGIVGPDYEVIQNRRSFEFLQELVSDADAVWESAGSMRGGRKVFVALRIPEHVTVDPGGLDDRIIPFIVAVNSHDGRSAYEVVATPWRPVCANTERLALKQAATRWKVRHTRNATDHIHEARRTLRLTTRYYDAWAAEETALARTDLAIDAFNAVIDHLWPIEEAATARMQRTAEARRARMHDLFEQEADRSGHTAYAAERAVTDYTDHFAAIRPSAASGMKGNEPAARGLRLLEGTDDEIKSRAHNRLMLLRRH